MFSRVGSAVSLAVAFNFAVMLGFNAGCAPSAPGFQVVEREGGFELRFDGRPVGRFAPCRDPNLSARDEIEEIEPGVFRWKRRLRRNSPVPAGDLRLTMDFVHAGPTSYHLIPAVSYNGNPWGGGNDPKGFMRDGVPWSFASHRTAVPGGTYAEGEAWATGLFGEAAADSLPFSCSLIPGEEETVHRLIWPEEEQPLTYSGRDTFSEGYRLDLDWEPAKELVLTAWVTAGPAEPGHRGVARFLDAAWSVHRHPVRPAFDTAALRRLGLDFAKRDLWAEEEDFRGFSIGLRWLDEKWTQRPVWKYEIGWAGQNASLAISLLRDYLDSGDEDSLKKGLACLDAWAEHAPLPNGLMHCHFDYILGEEFVRTDPEYQRERLDACNLGYAALNFFKAEETAGRCGRPRPGYREIALGICDFMLADQEESGRLGKAWDTDGACLDRDGTIGAFLIPALIEAGRVTGEARYLESARSAFEFYYRDFARKGFTTGGALDTDCIDKESAMPLLRSALMLHDLTGEEGWLSAAEHTAFYLATWQWHHTVRPPDGPWLDRLGYDSFGGTSVSTQHHHMDCCGLYFVPDWLRLAELTGREIWRERALAVWANAAFGISDGTLNTGEADRPAGSQGEAFFQTRWGFDSAFGSYNNWLVAWPTAFRLEILRTLADPSVLDRPADYGSR